MPVSTPFSQRLSLWLLVPLILVFVVVVGVFYISFTTAQVEGISMQPNLIQNDVLLVTRGYHAPIRGDIVTLVPPASSGLDPSTELVKRVVAVPGDEVEVRQGRAFVNGMPEKGPYTVYVANADTSAGPLTVPNDSVYVLGDNRPISEDSRIFGPVLLSELNGKVVAIFAPADRMRFVD